MKNIIFLENLPRKNGTGKSKGKQVIDWNKSIGYKIKGVFNDIQFEIKIISYKDRYLYIKYLNKNPFKIFCDSFKKCNLGALLGTKTSYFKIEIGTRFQDSKRNVTITDRKYIKKVDKNNKDLNEKWYKYTCNICGWTEGWISEGNLLKGTKCSVCAGFTVAEGINDIPTTNPEMVKFFQGGYDEAKLYTKTGSGDPNNKGGYIIPKCPDCDRIKDKKIKISKIYHNHSIGCSCSDSVPYGEKFTFSVLEQLGIGFQTQLNKSNFKWCKDYKYDFYFELNYKSYICEVNGIQHYIQTNRKGARTLSEEQVNDKLKKELALANGIKEDNYIVIDCRESTLKWIKDNDNGILNSKLNNLFDLKVIDWNKAEEFTFNNLVKMVCKYKKENPNMSTTDISNMTKFSVSTVYNWINKGSEFGFCNYNAENERKKAMIKMSEKCVEKCSKLVEIFKDGKSLGVFPSCAELSRRSKDLFGVKLNAGMISAVCLGKRKHHQNYTFQYVE